MTLPHLLAGTTREHYILLFGSAGAIAVVAGAIGAWVGSYFGARRAIALAVAGKQQAANDQLTPVMQALDSISLEVERISEAQRFTAKLMHERVPMSLPRAEPRVITPH